MAAPAPIYDPERTKQHDLNQITGINPAEEQEMDLAARKEQLNDLENSYNAPSAQDSQSTSPERLSDAEGAAANQVGDGYRNENENTAANAPLSGLVQKVRGLVTPKRALIGGGTITFIVILMMMASGFSAFELINLRENTLGHGNRFSNAVLQKSRTRTVGYMLNKMHDENTPKEHQDRIKDAFAKQKFKIDFDADGKLKEFSFTDSKGESRAFDLTNKNTSKATNDFFGGKDFGLDASRGFDKAVSSSGGLWGGSGARGLYGKNGFRFFNWLGRGTSNKAKTPSDKLAEEFRAADATEREAVKAQGVKNKQELGDGQKTTDSEGNTTSTTAAVDGADVMNGELNGNVTPEQYLEDLTNDPTAGEEKLGVDTGNIEQLVDDTGKSLTASGIKEAFLNSMGNGAFFKGSLTALTKSFNILGEVQTACTVKGIISFVSNVRNIMVTVELARFAVRILNAADDQKAGILSSSGLNLLMIYLTYPNPKNGRGHSAAGGEQSMFGDPNAHASLHDRSLFSMGRSGGGILSQINLWVNSIPGMDHCNIVQNGFVDAGGLAVGVVGAFASGGTLTGVQASKIAALVAVHMLVQQIAAPLLVKAASHMILNGHEQNGEMVGDAFAAGATALMGMVAGSNGMRMSTNKQIAALEPEVNAYERAEIADQSLYTRYLSPSNGNSLATHVAMALPASFHAASLQFSSGIAGFLHSLTSFGSLLSFLPGNKALAATGSLCDDPQVKAHDIATNDFCAPIMANVPDLDPNQTRDILRANNQIDENDNPTDTKVGGDDQKSFRQYAEQCLSGDPALLYNRNIEQDGSSKVTDDTCIESGPTLPGDTVGRYDRFSSWYNNICNESTISEQWGVPSTTLQCGDQ